MNAVLGRPTTEAVGRSARQGIDLWSLCVWAYQRQRAHILLKSPYDWFTLYVAAIGMAGEDAPRPSVHRDAAAVHAAVMSLDQDQVERIVFAASFDIRPEAPDACIPTPQPPAVDRQVDRWGWLVRADTGRRVDYKLAVAERLLVEVPVWEKRGKRYVQAGVERVEQDVLYCPVDWSPDLSWMAFETATYEGWVAAMQALLAAMDDVYLRDFRVTGFVAAPCYELPEVVCRDARAAMIAQGVGPAARLAPVASREGIVHDHGKGQSFYHHVRAVAG